MRMLFGAIAVMVGLAGSVQAAVIDFSGSGYDDYTVTGGKPALNGCPYDSTIHDTTPCIQYNGTGTGGVTYAGGLFDLLAVKFHMRGQPDDGPPNGVTLQGRDALGAVVAEARFYIGLDTGAFGDAWVQDGNVPILRLNNYTLIFGPGFQGISSLFIFSDDPEQNVRLDDFVVRAHVVPLPAAGLMLAGGLAGLAALRRRKRG